MIGCRLRRSKGRGGRSHQSVQGNDDRQEEGSCCITESIEEKVQRVADLGVEIAEMKNDFGDSIEALAEDKAF